MWKEFITLLSYKMYYKTEWIYFIAISVSWTTEYYIQNISAKFKSYIQGIAEGHQCEYENWLDIFIKYFWNTEIKVGAMLMYIYITRVTSCNIDVDDKL